MAHKCPYESRYDKDTKSTFKRDYIKHQLSKNPSARYEREIRYYPYERDVMKTTHQNDFPKHKITPQENFKPADQPAGTDLPFSKQSEYSKNYLDLNPGPYKSCKPQTASQARRLFDYSSVYKQDFNQYAVPKTPQQQKEGKLDYPKNYGFSGKTTYKNDFHKLAMNKNQFYKFDGYKPRPVPFDGQTIYNSSYHNFNSKTYEPNPKGGTIKSKCCENDEQPNRPKQLSPGKSQTPYQKSGWI